MKPCVTCSNLFEPHNVNPDTGMCINCECKAEGIPCAPVASKPIALKDDSASVRKQIQEMLDRADEFSGVVLIGHNKGGGTYLRCSTMSQGEIAALFCLFQSWVNDLFQSEAE